MELYTLTVKKRTMGETAVAAIWGVLALACIVLTYALIFAFVPAIIFILLWYFWTFRRYFEFEVSYFDGDFRIAKVINKSRRKRIMAFTMDDVVQIAPQGDRSVYKYENDTQIKNHNCYSLEADAVVYDIIIKKENKLSLLKVELDDKMLNEICKKYQQKVIRKA
ncbi:MAG: EI24 domain-containing protein [Lachnospiraceae bacterium]|nr:EI24 domain-containing protein [Lachnospiraceae bacterium]